MERRIRVVSGLEEDIVLVGPHGVDEALLRLRLTEPSFPVCKAREKSDGEREAAKRAAERIRARLEELRGREKEVVLLYSLPDPWKRKLFVALCRRYGLKPYRQPGRRYSTVMVRAPQTFQHQTLFPEFEALAEELDTHLAELTDRVIREAIHSDVSEASEGGEPKALSAPASSASHAPSEGTATGVDSGKGSPT